MTSNSSREKILARVREAIADNKIEGGLNKFELPPVPVVWQTDDDNNTNIDLNKNNLISEFKKNIEQVSGEFVECKNRLEIVKHIANIVRELDKAEVGIIAPGNTFVRDNAEELKLITGVKLYDPPETKQQIDMLSVAELSTCDIGIIEPEALLADTGSGLFCAKTRFERLAVYLPPISVIVATESILYKNLPEAWKEVNNKIKETKTGEFVIVTGPSRTADIEKILILGVHGPKRVVVYLLRDEK
ncbi:MAG: lactate utilization protein [Planctomycetaceae bacterium]|jgi:L-lactate dehydrogenase complex protein LldG|nr:lactate utilization protein [Planctomycetaceae bacterium]